MINWGVCVPSQCTATDVELSLREYVDEFTKGTGFSVEVRVEPQMCQIKNNTPYDRNTKLVG